MKKLASLFLALTLCMALAIPALAATDPATSFTVDFGGKQLAATDVTFRNYDFAQGKAVPAVREVQAVEMSVGDKITFHTDYEAMYSNVSIHYTLLMWDSTDVGFSDTTSLVADGNVLTIPEPVSQLGYLSDWGLDLVNAKYAIRCLVMFNDGELMQSTDLAEYYVLLTAPEAPAKPEAPAQSAVSFSDVKESDYFAQSVQWAVNAGITNGTSETTFSPNALCTKAHILTFVWRATDGIEYPLESPYTDLTDSSAYYYSAAMWASRYQYDPTDGGEGSTFNADAAYTRANTVELLWNIAGKPAPSKSVNFTDVAADASYAQAVAWAVEQGITNGTSETTFSPDATCTRGQIVTFLYRTFA